MQLIRPPPLPPPAEGTHPHPLPRLDANGRQPVVRIKHPDYPPPVDVLITIPAVDPLPSPSSSPTGQGETAAEEVEVSVGLHYGTVLTICSIIADDAFDIYLSYNREGTRRVDDDWHSDNILPAGEYWAQVPQASSTPVEARELVSTIPTPVAEGRRQEERTTSARKQKPYPIVPNFENWRFPHGQLPALWMKDHDPPLSALHQRTSTSPSTPTSISNSTTERLRALQPITRSCAISAHRGGLEMAHLVHSRYKDWFLDNDMVRYGSTTAILPIDQPFNKIALRADLHTLFDSAHLTIVPKPVFITPLPPTSTLTSTSISTSGTTSASQATRYALAVHTPDIPGAQLELIPLYHNRALCFQDIGNEFSRQYKSSREYLFARFAWSIFPLLRTFLEKKRLVTIRVKGQQGNVSATAALSSEAATFEYKWESNSSLAVQSRSVSRKRSASQMSQAKDYIGCNDDADELDDHLWRKRRRSSPVVFPLDEEAERLLDWATRRREAVAESNLSPQFSGYADVGVEELPRGRRRSRRRHGENISNSNSPRGSVPDLSVSFGSDSSTIPDHKCYDDGVGNDNGDGVYTTEGMSVKDSPSSVEDIALQEDINSI